jgi:hypothetical protein
MAYLNSFANKEVVSEVVSIDGSAAVFTTPLAGASLVKHVALSATLLVMTYLDTATGYAKVVAGTKNADYTITWGTPVDFNLGSVSWCTPIRVSDTKFCIGYTDALTGYGTMIVGTIAGTTITLGTKLACNAVATSVLGLSLLDTDKVVMVFQETTANFKGIVATFTGTTVAYGAAVVIYAGDVVNSTYNYANVDQINFQQVDTLSTTTAIVAYGYYNVNTQIATVVLSISGTVITVNAANIHNTAVGSSYGNIPRVQAMTSTTFALSHMAASNSTQLLLVLYSISGTTITRGNATTVATANNYMLRYGVLRYLGNNRLFIVYEGFTSVALTATLYIIASATASSPLSLSLSTRGDITYRQGDNYLINANTQNEGYPYARFFDVSSNQPAIDAIKYPLVSAGANEQVEISSLYAKNAGVNFSSTNLLQLYKGGTTQDKCFYNGGYSDQFSPTTSAPCVPMTLPNSPIILKGGETLYASFTNSYYGKFVKGSVAVYGIRRS